MVLIVLDIHLLDLLRLPFVALDDLDDVLDDAVRALVAVCAVGPPAFLLEPTALILSLAVLLRHRLPLPLHLDK